MKYPISEIVDPRCWCALSMRDYVYMCLNMDFRSLNNISPEVRYELCIFGAVDRDDKLSHEETKLKRAYAVASTILSGLLGNGREEQVVLMPLDMFPGHHQVMISAMEIMTCYVKLIGAAETMCYTRFDRSLGNYSSNDMVYSYSLKKPGVIRVGQPCR